MNKFDLFNDTEEFKITKPIRLIELFAGYGSQHFAFKYLGVNVESYKICEWAVKSIQAYKDAHFNEDNKDYSKNLSKSDIIEYLTARHISMDYNQPMTKEQITRLGEEKLRAIYNNIQATHNLVDIQQTKGNDLQIVDKDKYDYIMTYSFPCLVNDSLILTKRGYIELKDVTLNDYVLTKSNTWQKVSKKFDNGIHQTYYLQGMGFENIHCTENHKFWVRRMYHKGHKSMRCFKEPEFKEVKDITKKDYFGVPVIQEEISFYTDDLDFWYMLGMYVGDGWLSYKGNDILISCNDIKLNKLKKALNIDKWKYTVTKQKTCYRLRFANKEIKTFIEKYIGTGCLKKHIPYEIMCLPKKQLQQFYNGYLDSDGSIVKGKHQFTTINRNLIYSISCIINKLYQRPTSIYFNRANPKKQIENRIVNQHNWYQLRFNPLTNKQDKAFYEDGYIWYPFTKLEKAEKENVYNMEIENDHSYIVQGCISKNCQDLSLAGKGAGMEKGSSTRSGMLWEVERILDECKELPQVLVMENVTQVHGTKNIKDFNSWQIKLESLGYKNYVQDLNAKNFGIPQNRDRCFMVSLLGDYSFDFPEKFSLAIRLKDILEKSVEEKYYLSKQMILGMANTNFSTYKLENKLVNKNSVAKTILARFDGAPQCILDSGLLEPLACASRGRNPDNPNSRKSGEHLEQMIEINPTGCSNCLTTVQKDNYVLEKNPAKIQKVIQLDGYESSGRVYSSSGISPTLCASTGGGHQPKVIEMKDDLQVQKLVKIRKHKIDITKLQKLLQSSKQQFTNKEISTKLGIPLTTVEHWFRQDKSFAIPDSEIWFKLKELLNINTNEFDDFITDFEFKPTSFEMTNRFYNEDGLSPTILTGNTPNVCIKDDLKTQVCDKIIESGLAKENDIIDYSFSNSRLKELENGKLKTMNKDKNLSCTITTTAQNFGIVEENLKSKLCNQLIENNMIKENDVIRHSYSNNRMNKMYIQNQINHDCSPTLDTRCDCLGVCVDDKDVSNTLSSNFVDINGKKCKVTKDSPNYIEWEQEKRIQSDRRAFKDDKISQTITTTPNAKVVNMSSLRIRKFTPKECFRLMGVKDNDFENIAKNQSNASLYHLAGDSIVTSVLMAIFGELMGIDYKDKIKDLQKFN